MKIIYTTEELQAEELKYGSIFLAGPSPRNSNVGVWRNKAIEYIKELDFKGVIYNPEQRIPGLIDFTKSDYPADWENSAMLEADIILFWVPRCIKTLPGFTTNVEFGRFVPSSDYIVFYGRPDNADKIKYLDWLWNKFRIGESIHTSLENLVGDVVNYVKEISGWYKE